SSKGPRNGRPWRHLTRKIGALAAEVKLRVSLHVRVVESASALRRGPGDVLRGVLDVAGLAVDAVLEVDLEPRVLALVVVEHLVDACRTVEPGGLPTAGQVHLDRDLRVLQLQVRGLVLLVVGG